MRRSYIAIFMILLVLSGTTHTVWAQFPPSAGAEGSTAIAADSGIFVGWAVDAYVVRGWVQCTDTTLGRTDFGENSMVLSIADNAVVSLGDGGWATMSFQNPLVDGPGWDFAVFENGFTDEFLELAMVEVSSDGENFFRFPSVSLTDTLFQVETFGTLDATHLNNLAGKYRQGYGTPFDLHEMKDVAGLDIQNVVAVRVVDVVGSLDPRYGMTDSFGHIINDPWPTPFNTGGFDLDAVGVIHDKLHNTIDESVAKEIRCGPNPFSSRVMISSPTELDDVMVISANAGLIWKRTSLHQSTIYTDSWPAGLYLVKWTSGEQSGFIKILKQ